MEKRICKILVVDDTEPTRYALARTLRANGYDTVEAKTGREALNLVHTERPDLVTLDIHLPDILGFEVCRQIKADPRTHHIPVLQVSASYVRTSDRIHGLEGGADSYLTHPFEPPVLLATIKALLRGRELNEELRLSEERFRVALKNAPVMTYTCDLDLKYTWIYNPPNPLSAEDFLGKSDYDVFSEVDADRLTALKQSALKNGHGQRSTIPLCINGKSHFFDLTIEPLLSSSGGVLGLTVATFDISDRIKAQEDQKQAAEDAELANQAKTRFLSNMSHEIRTPLGIIQGFADLALGSDISESDRQEFLTTIKRNAHNLTKLLGEILDLSKVESGRIEIEKAWFSLPELISEVVSAFSMQAKEKALKVSVEIEDSIPEAALSDSTRVRQVLINLISNAIKFTSQGGINIFVRSGSPQSHNGLSVIEIEVEDSGVGLDNQQQTRLFQPFIQADSSTTRKFGGTGLGLVLSKKLAQALGGDVVLLKSVLNKGSTFLFSFDAGSAAPPQTLALEKIASEIISSYGTKTSEELDGLRVLLADDSVDNQRLVSRYLKRCGANVDLASDGVEGVEMARATSYDVILMDIQMPNLDGYGAAAVLHSEGLKTPIVALTAHAMREEKDQALRLGFSDYLTKPINPTVLIQSLIKYHRP